MYVTNRKMNGDHGTVISVFDTPWKVCEGIWKEGWLHVSNFGESRIVNPEIHYFPEMRPSLVLVSVYVTLVVIVELEEIPRIFKSFMCSG